MRHSKIVFGREMSIINETDHELSDLENTLRFTREQDSMIET